MLQPSLQPFYRLCITLSTVTLSDNTSAGITAGTTIHALTWKSNGTCNGTYTGTITESYRAQVCSIIVLSASGTRTFAATGNNGTYSPLAVSNGYIVTFTITLSDGNGHTVTSNSVN